MEKLAKALTLAVLAAALALIGLQAGARLDVRVDSVTAQDADDREEIFSNLIAAIGTGDLSGAYRVPETANSKDYSLVTVQATVRNPGILPAEWVLLGAQRLDGDIVLVPGDAKDIPPFSEAVISCVVVTERAYADAPRAAWAEYYVLGRSMTSGAAS